MLLCCLLVPLLATRYKRREISLPAADYPGNNSASWERTRAGVHDLYQRLLDLAPGVPIVGNVWQYPLQTQHYTEIVHRLTERLGRAPLVCETGFGSGLSTIAWLLFDSGTKVVTFDWSKDDAGGADPWFPRRKRDAAEVIRRRFGDRWRLVDGDSRQTIPREVQEGLSCDLFHIDGAHVRGGVLADLRHFHGAARKARNVVLLDDMHFREIQKGMEDFRLVGALNLSQCIQTKARDPLFVFPGKPLRKRKVWCWGSFVTDWKPTQEWEKLFEYITGVTASGELKQVAPTAATPPASVPSPVQYRSVLHSPRAASILHTEGREGRCDPPGPDCDKPLTPVLPLPRTDPRQPRRRRAPLPEGRDHD
eukprot:Hpha_TRINITY_DN23524_c0_g1::TRINITY_DN23524_c0_g1_i1::g.186486::m.186486